MSLPRDIQRKARFWNAIIEWNLFTGVFWSALLGVRGRPVYEPHFAFATALYSTIALLGCFFMLLMLLGEVNPWGYLVLGLMLAGLIAGLLIGRVWKELSVEEAEIAFRWIASLPKRRLAKKIAVAVLIQVTPYVLLFALIVAFLS